MNIFYAVLLGIIQGLTEFLPVSSTAHLTLAGGLFGLIDPARPEDWTAFIAIIQLGTVTAVIIYFFKDIIGMVTHGLHDIRTAPAPGTSRWSAQSHLTGKIILGTIPVAIIGLAFKKIIEGAITKEIAVIGTSLIVLALILWWAEKVGKRIRTEEQTTWKDALIVGFAQ